MQLHGILSHIKFQDRPKQVHPPTDQEPRPSGSAITKTTLMSAHNSGGLSTQDTTGDPKLKGSGRTSQSISLLRHKRPGISGWTVLIADIAQVKTKQI